MAKHSLVIVESPAKAKTIGKYLGKEFEVKACMGHLRDLPKSTLGVDLEHDFEPVYKPIKGKEDIIADLKKSAKSAEMVYLATDPDREGEAISWHLKEMASPSRSGSVARKTLSLFLAAFIRSSMTSSLPLMGW